jgi:hypothetical protein
MDRNFAEEYEFEHELKDLLIIVDDQIAATKTGNPRIPIFDREKLEYLKEWLIKELDAID